MSKYLKLWEFIATSNKDKIKMSFDEIATILGFAIDHSFLSYKKELLKYGYIVGKISIKEQTVEFVKK